MLGTSWRRVIEGGSKEGLYVAVSLRRRGYSTPEEKAAAQQLDGVRSITLKQFNELLKWGLIAGVDDGCGDDN